MADLIYDKNKYVIKPDPNMTPAKFKSEFEKALEETDYDTMRCLRIGTWLETKKRLKGMPKPRKSSAQIDFSGEDTPFSEYYDDMDKWNLPPLSATEIQGMNVEVLEEDILEVATTLKKELTFANPDSVVGVLNMACFGKPGGGVESGAGAQEENMCRRTDLMQHLATVKYPLGYGSCFSSPGVSYFRGKESEGYPDLEENQSFCVVSAAGFNKPPLYVDEETDEEHIVLEFAKKTYLTMRAIFKAAEKERMDGLVLSALACGAFGNPPKDIARLFAYAMRDSGYKRKVIFAILPDYRNGSENARVFRDEFSVQ